MKKILNILLIVSLAVLSAGVIAQPPPPPPTPDQGGNKPIGASGSIESGTLFLISLAGLYGGKKVHSLWRNRKKE
ncbi:MAG: hypothetical protein WCI92_10995 [Bacteroidota bacterium]